MTIILFDTPDSRKALYPFSLNRSLADIRYGIFTNRERWEKVTGNNVHTLTEDYLQQPIPNTAAYWYVDTQEIITIKQIESLLQAQKTENHNTVHQTDKLYSYSICSQISKEIAVLNTATYFYAPWQLLQFNEQAIRDDFEWITKGRESATIHSSNTVFGKENIFAENGVVMRACVINAENGPVYIGENALIMEGSTIRGPVAICNHATVKMGTKIYPGTTIGPYCTVGGEIKNSILMGYSNKAHDGYLGDAIIGEWCNLGAGTSNSNVKNTGSEVKMWDELKGDFVTVGKKAGLMMGDYCRSAINTSFNTGTTVGICCNVFGNGFPSKHVRSFHWGNEQYALQKVISDIDRWKQMKGKTINEKEIYMLQHLYKTMSNF